LKILNFIRWYIDKLIPQYTICHHGILSLLTVCVVALIPFADSYTRAVVVVVIFSQYLLIQLIVILKAVFDHLKTKYADFNDECSK
jgi:hypothetical protein